VKKATDPNVNFTITPANVMTLVEFTQKIGRMKRMPGSWKGLFLPPAHGLQGT
jgi:NitT/TauT family transport system substrate-binding protein